jgi:hypothetical protein
VPAVAGEGSGGSEDIGQWCTVRWTIASPDPPAPPTCTSHPDKPSGTGDIRTPARRPRHRRMTLL